MNTMFDLAPLWRSGIGFDHLFDVLGQAANSQNPTKYPSYNIERPGKMPIGSPSPWPVGRRTRSQSRPSRTCW
jgi:hypothetical protein